MKSNFLRAAVLLAMAASATAASAQAPKTDYEINTPYVCPDGTSYTFTQRVGTGYRSTCYVTVEKKGRRVTKKVIACRQMTGYLRGCKLQSSASPSARPGSGGLEDTQYNCGPGLTVAVFACQNRQGQSSCLIQLRMNGPDITPPPMTENQIREKLRTCKELPPLSPPYALEFPSAATVLNAMRAMRASDPQETVRRFIGAFYQLGEILKVLAGSRASTGYLPDEKKLIDQYGRAESALEAAGPKKFPGQQFGLAANPYHYGPMDPRFGFEGIPVWISFFTPGMHDRYARLVGGDDPSYMAKVRQEWQTGLQEAQAKVMRAAQTLQAENHSSSPYAGNDDGGRAEVRSCMESGRSQMECVGEGLKAGLADLVGGGMAKGMAKAIQGPDGLRLTGVYSSANLQINFDASNAKVSCGSLVTQPHPYTVKRTGYQLLIGVPISPKPLTLSYGPDGRLMGPGSIAVDGRIVTGNKTITWTEYETKTEVIHHSEYGSYGFPTADSTRTVTVPVQKTRTIVLTAPKTESCNAAVLPPKGAAPTLSGVLTQTLGTQASESQNTAPGLRLNGSYASPGGLKIEFRGDSATLECSDSEHSEGYAVLPESGQLVVKFQNDTGPFALTLEPNGTLAGSGTVEVTGRVMTGLKGTEPVYLPRNARCAVGTFAPSK